MESFLNVCGNIWSRLVLTIPATYFILNEEHFLVVYALLLVVFLDTVLGVAVSVKYKISRSHMMSRVASKVTRYLVALLSMWILAIVEPTLFGWTYRAFGVFLILTEVLSNLEKLSILGMEIPSKFLAKINKDFNAFYFGNEGERKDAVKRIIKKTCTPDEIDVKKRKK